MRWPPCVKHSGRHMDVHGQCVHYGAPVAMRPGVCPQAGCGAEVMRFLDLSNGRLTTVEAGSDQPHTHAAPIRVELDPDALATAIVTASRAARQERQQEQPSRPVLVADPEPPARPPTTAPERDIPTVTVWTDDGSGA